MSVKEVKSFAPAKVNLFLQITGRRPDGYHELDSLAVFAAVGDNVSVSAADALQLVLTGPHGEALKAEPDNIVLRAARLLAEAAGIAPRVRIILEKNLPVASGIGGGSADAAAALRALCALWGLKLPLDTIALRLGADVPVCLARKDVRMGGIGEILRKPPTMPDFGLVLINPGVQVATKAVFERFSGVFSQPAELPAAWRYGKFMAADLCSLTNDLEAPAIGLAPVIGEVLAALRADRKCLVARMSGSGATCYGVYENPADAAIAAVALQEPNWWVWGGGLAEILVGDI